MAKILAFENEEFSTLKDSIIKYATIGYLYGNIEDITNKNFESMAKKLGIEIKTIIESIGDGLNE